MRKVSGKHLEWAGINTCSLGLRARTNRLREVPSHIKKEFYEDFGKVIEEWWSFSHNWIKVTRNGVKADANNGAYSIEMRPDLTVYIGGSKKQFKIEDSLYEIILWVDQQTRNKFASSDLSAKLVRKWKRLISGKGVKVEASHIVFDSSNVAELNFFPSGFKSYKQFETSSTDEMRNYLDSGAAGFVPNNRMISVHYKKDMSFSLIYDRYTNRYSARNEKKAVSEIVNYIVGQTRSVFARNMKEKFLREKVVKLAYANPHLRSSLLPLVNGKVASDESLELRLTKIAYVNPELRKHLLPLIKQANFFKKIMEKIKKMVFPNKKTKNKVKFDSLPQKQKDEIIESAKEKAEKEQEKADKKKEEETEEPKEEKKEEKTEEKSVKPKEEKSEEPKEEKSEEPKEEKVEEKKEEPKEEPKEEKSEEPKKEVDKSNPFGRSKLDQALNILKNYAMSDDTDMDEEKYKQVERNLKRAPEKDLKSYVHAMATYEKEGEPDMDWTSKADKEEKKKKPKDRSNESKTKALKNILNEDKIKKIMEESDLTGYKAGTTESSLKALLEGEEYGEKIEDVYAYIEKKSENSHGKEIFKQLLGDLEKELGPGESKKESSLSLRLKVVRLAHQNPSLRKDLLPLIKSAKTFNEWVESQNGFPNPNPKGRQKTVQWDSLPKEEQAKYKKKWEEAKEKDKGEDKDKKENVSGKWDRTLQERAENILRNIEDKEQKGSDHLDRMLKKFKNMSDSSIENWLQYVEEYETEKAPEPPKFKDKKEKEQMEKEEARKTKNLSEQKSSEKLFGQKKIDDLMSSLDKFLPDNHTYEELKAINKEMGADGPGVLRLTLSKGMHRDMKRDLEKALKENRRNNKGQWKNMADKDIEKLYKDLEKTKKENPHPIFVREVDKIIKDIKESVKGSNKKASLRLKVAKLAYENPSLRKDLLPLLKKLSG